MKIKVSGFSDQPFIKALHVMFNPVIGLETELSIEKHTISFSLRLSLLSRSCLCKF